MDANPDVIDEIGYRSVEWAVEVVREFRQINEGAQRLQAALAADRRAELELTGAGLEAVAAAMAHRVRPSVIEEAHAWLVSTEKALDMWVGALSHPLCTVEDDETTDTWSGATVGDETERRVQKLEADMAEVLSLLRAHLASCPSASEDEVPQPSDLQGR